METLLERWSKADEEMKVYDVQLQRISQTPLFQDMLLNKAPKALDPKSQLFNNLPKVVRRTRVSSRKTKK